ncbi:unnamed protein product, partial [marine sediment metagenome]
AMTYKEVKALLTKLLDMGHYSALEHASFTFGVEGISRACSHQFVRHRIASFSQKSQRYVTEDGGFDLVMPDSIRDSAHPGRFKGLMAKITDVYELLIKDGVPAEDARFVLPNACETKLVVTMNARELMHLFSKRCCNRAQWEMREVAIQMFEAAINVAPVLFSRTGPGCLHGDCPEKDMTCNMPVDSRLYE